MNHALVRMWLEWSAYRRENGDVILPLEELGKEELSHWLTRFILKRTINKLRSPATMPADPRRVDRVRRYQPTTPENSTTTDGINAVGMVCSLVGLLIKMKWAAWVGVYCSLIYMAHSKSSSDKKQLLSLFMLATSSLVMVYMQNPAPMTLSLF